MSDRPNLTPRLLIATATRVLPRGVSRERYRREFAAELYGMGRGAQLHYAVGVFTHIWSLRVVLIKGVDAVHVPILCRTNIHHHWRRYTSDEKVGFEVCARCGKEKDPIELSRADNAGGAVITAFGNWK